MKRKQTFIVIALLATSVLVSSCGGTKSVTGISVSDASKEAKKLEKEGWTVAPGALPLERQLEKSYKLQYEEDENLTPKYITGDAMSIGENYDAAKLQATELAKLSLAGKIETMVMAEIKNSVSNEQLSNEQAASITKSIGANKNIIAQKLGRVIPLVELYRTKLNKNKEVRIVLGYNKATAMEEAKEVIRQDLKKETEDLHNELDNLFKLK